MPLHIVRKTERSANGWCTFVDLLARNWDPRQTHSAAARSTTNGQISGVAFPPQYPYIQGGWSDDVTCSNRPLLAFLPPLSRLALLAWTAILVPFQRPGKLLWAGSFRSECCG
jgi:hypothetical protein